MAFRGGNRLLLVFVILFLCGMQTIPAKKKSKSNPSQVHALREALAHENQAISFANSGKYHEAMEEFQTAMTLLKQAGERGDEVAEVMGRVYTFMGHIHTILGQLPEGIKFWKRGIKFNPKLSDARQNIVKSLSDSGDHQQALKYASEGAAIEPNVPESHVQVGDTCRNLKNYTCAKQAYSRALELDKNHFSALFSLAVAHRDLMEDRPALELFERAARIDPGSASVINALAVVRGDTCLWSDPDYSQQGKHNRLVQVARATHAADGGPKASPIHPLLLAYHLDDPFLLTEVAASHALEAAREVAVATGRAAVRHPDHLAGPAPTSAPPPLRALRAEPEQMFSFGHLRGVSLPPGSRVAERKRLRVGYLTADIHDHPTALLVQGMFGLQRAGGEAEVFMYSYGFDDNSVYRRSIALECEHFVELFGVPFLEVAKRVNEDGVHVLVDMKQHTESHALNVIALHPAPIQIAWLGFPGGIGGGLAQYLVGDAVVAPPDHASFFPERLALLPPQVSYQVNNYAQDPFIGERAPALPAGVDPDVPRASIVFTSLNHPRKIKPRRFRSYLAILAAVDNSSLSLLSRHETTGANLQREAQAAGVAPSRIHIAKVLGKAEHMLRFRHSSLFLDTFPYAAHTTCSEALYAHLPVLTRPGRTFASRVPASLLHALGVNGATVVATEKEFVELGIRIGGGGGGANGARQTNAVRRRLRSVMERARQSSVLFRQEVWVRHWTRLLKSMWEVRRADRKASLNLMGSFRA